MKRPTQFDNLELKGIYIIMKSNLKFTAILLSILTCTFFITNTKSFAQGGHSKSNTTVKGKTVLKVIKTNNHTAMFARLLKESGFSKVLTKKGPFTVLAPNNNAIKSNLNVSKLKKKPNKLKSLVRHHLYQGNLPKKKVESALGVKIVGTKRAVNGVVYIIDTVVRQTPSNG